MTFLQEAWGSTKRRSSQVQVKVMRLALTVYEPPDFVRKQVDEVLEKYDA